MTWTAPRTWVTGETVTAAIMNTHVRDNLLAIGGSWAADGRAASAIWQGATTNPAIGNGTLTSRILTAGQTIHWIVQILMGSTTTFGSGAWLLTLPTGSLLTGMAYDAAIRDTSAGKTYPAVAELVPASTTTATLRILNTTAGGEFLSVDSSGTRPIPWASGDSLSAAFEFEKP